MKKTHVFLLTLLITLVVGSLSATLLLEDNFTGTGLLTDNGWTAHSGAGTNNIPIVTTDLTYTGYQSYGGGSSSLLANGEDVNKAFTTQASGDTYYSCLVNVTAATIAGDYVIHLGGSTLGSAFYARVYIKKVDASTNSVYFGLNKQNETTIIYDTVAHPYGSTVLIIVRYSIVTDAGNDVVSMWVNPALGSSTPTPTLSLTPTATPADAADMGHICLRQGGATSGPTAYVDGIRVGTTWADCGGLAAGNQAPAITNISRTPSGNVESFNTVSVSADINDTDGTVNSANLTWGTVSNPGSLPNMITMTGVGGYYTTDSPIPAQSNGTTVYYQIFADDDDGDGTLTSEMSYTVRDPATTTIPYSQDFTTGFGTTYTYSVAGANVWYIYLADTASCNGFGLNPVEDWMILPAINFNNYNNERMSFNTTAAYGTIDANNYLKLYYSTNYYGLGDPTSAAWTEIPYTPATPVITPPGVETPSGVLNLSGISGTNVYLGFKYYSTDAPTRWEVDDISIYTATPTLTVTPITLTGFTYAFGSGPSTPAKTFTLSGADLTNNVSVAAPTNYQISKNGTAYATPLIYTPAEVATPQTVYVQLKAGLAIGLYNDEVINITSTSATPKTVTCSGEVTTPPAPGAPVATAGTSILGNSFVANWDPSAGATGYYLDVYTVTSATATDLIISEYVEGLSSNKYIEIFNGTGSTVDLTDYKLQLFANGAIAPSQDIALSGTLANGACIVYKNSLAALTLPDGVIAIDNAAVNFNGNDAVALYKVSTLSFVDIFGWIGAPAPTTAWGTDPLITKDKTLVRKSTVTGGVTVNPVSGDFTTLATEWISYDVDTATYLGSHSINTNTYVTGFNNRNVNNVTTYPVPGLASATTYYYVVRAYNAYGTSGNSNEITVLTTGGLGSPVAAIYLDGGAVKLSWPTIPGATGYKVYGSNDPYALPFPGAWTLLTPAPVNSPYTYTGIETFKFFKVTANN
jgi:hypothetical protein